MELRTGQESAVIVQRSVCPPPSNSPLQSADPPLSTDKDELSVLKAGLRKVKIFTDYVSTRRAKKPCREEEGSEGRSEDGDYTYPLDSDSLDEFPEGESDEGKNEDSRVRKSFSYGTLAYANCIGGSIYSDMTEDEDWIYSNRRKSDVGCSQMEDSATSSTSEPSLFPTSKRSIILPWRKRKLNFRSPKAKGEPLLKKAYGEEGGDDIDFDRRQLSSDESLSFGVRTVDLSISVFKIFVVVNTSFYQVVEAKLLYISRMMLLHGLACSIELSMIGYVMKRTIPVISHFLNSNFCKTVP